ncbi:hypothetical protein PG984_012421 [Apiospora sp. TS-2023a]
MLHHNRDSPLGKVREVRWRVITAEMRGWGWGFSLRSLKLQWEASLQPRLEEVLNEGVIQLPVAATREQRIARLAGPQLTNIDGVNNGSPKPPEPAPFCGSEEETVAPPKAPDSPALPGATEQDRTFYVDKPAPESLGMSMEIQNALLDKFRQFTVEELLGARAFMTALLEATNRSCEAAVNSNMHPGPVYHLRHQLHYIHFAWSQVLDGHRPLTQKQHEGIRACEVAEEKMRDVHCENNRRFREWRLRGWFPTPARPSTLLGQQQLVHPVQQQGLYQQQQYVQPPLPLPPPPPSPPHSTTLTSPQNSPFRLGTETMPLGNGYPVGYQPYFPAASTTTSAPSLPVLNGSAAAQQPVPTKAKKQPKSRTEAEDEDGFWDETDSDSPKKGTKKRAKKEVQWREEQVKEREEKRQKQNNDRQERAARRERKKEGKD